MLPASCDGVRITFGAPRCGGTTAIQRTVGRGSLIVERAPGMRRAINRLSIIMVMGVAGGAVQPLHAAGAAATAPAAAAAMAANPRDIATLLAAGRVACDKLDDLKEKAFGLAEIGLLQAKDQAS